MTLTLTPVGKALILFVGSHIAVLKEIIKMLIAPQVILIRELLAIIPKLSLVLLSIPEFSQWF